MNTNPQTTAIKLHELEKKLDLVKTAFAKILRKQKQSLKKSNSFNVSKYYENLSVQHEALLGLQEVLLKMSADQEKADLNDAERYKMLSLIKKNYFLQKNLGAFLIKNKPSGSESKVDIATTTESHIILLGEDLKVKELFLDENISAPIKLSKEYRVIEQLMDEIEQSKVDGQLEDKGKIKRTENDLSQIKGLTEQLKNVLSASGIDSLEKLAALSPAEVSKMDKRILFRGKFKKYDWVGQAENLLR